MVLKLSKNPCASESNYRKNIVLSLSKLEELDGIEITLEERLLYQGALKNPLAIKIAEDNLASLIRQRSTKKEKRAEMSEAEKKENIEEFSKVSELKDMMHDAKALLKNSHARLTEIREQSFKKIESINDKFIQLLKATNGKYV